MRCYDNRALVGLVALVVVGIVVGIVFAPSSAWTLLPVLALLACPLSMLVMMHSVRDGSQFGRPASAAPGSGAESELQRLRAEFDDLSGRRDVGPEAVAGSGGAL